MKIPILSWNFKILSQSLAAFLTGAVPGTLQDDLLWSSELLDEESVYFATRYIVSGFRAFDY
jgi:hypothetical protein